MNKLYNFAVSLILLLSSCHSKPVSLDQLLQSENISHVEPIEADTTQFKQAFLLYFIQPVDHNDPSKGTFEQRVWLSHIDQNAPVVIVTEGYSANRNYTTELAKLTNANQIIVEHRYFARSTPENKDWQYLTIEQAANDHHKIIEYFKSFYNHKWISTGISKGGQTTLYHRSFYPNDVDISVPYVAPINLAREDQRLFNFFNEIGTKQDRNKIKSFQESILENRDRILPLFRQYAQNKGYTFRMGLDQAFELVVLEYPFSFWQWHGQTDQIPSANATMEDLFNHLSKYSDISYVSDQSWEDMQPFFYQAYTELGYYGYVQGEFKPLIKTFDKDTISSCFFAPEGVDLNFDPTAMKEVMRRLKKSDPEILAIVGGNDPWGSTSILTDSLTNTLKIVSTNGNHRTRISNLDNDQKELAISTIMNWMNE